MGECVIDECRCDERLKTRVEESTRLVYVRVCLFATGLKKGESRG